MSPYFMTGTMQIILDTQVNQQCNLFKEPHSLRDLLKRKERKKHKNNAINIVIPRMFEKLSDLLAPLGGGNDRSCRKKKWHK